MLAVRFVKEPDWKKAMTRGTEGKATPAYALHDFTPTRREAGVLSLYWLADEQGLDQLASAFWLSQKEPFIVVGIEKEIFDGLELETKDTEGDTFHDCINPNHFDVVVKDAEQAMALAEAFFRHGQYLPIEERTMMAQIANDNAESQIDFTKLHKSNNSAAQSKVQALLKAEMLHLCSEKKQGSESEALS